MPALAPRDEPKMLDLQSLPQSGHAVGRLVHTATILSCASAQTIPKNGEHLVPQCKREHCQLFFQLVVYGRVLTVEHQSGCGSASRAPNFIVRAHNS